MLSFSCHVQAVISCPCCRVDLLTSMIQLCFWFPIPDQWALREKSSPLHSCNRAFTQEFQASKTRTFFKAFGFYFASGLCRSMSSSKAKAAKSPWIAGSSQGCSKTLPCKFDLYGWFLKTLETHMTHCHDSVVTVQTPWWQVIRSESHPDLRWSHCRSRSCSCGRERLP